MAAVLDYEALAAKAPDEGQRFEQNFRALDQFTHCSALSRRSEIGAG
jgi:hypothetical protein